MEDFCPWRPGYHLELLSNAKVLEAAGTASTPSQSHKNNYSMTLYIVGLTGPAHTRAWRGVCELIYSQAVHMTSSHGGVIATLGCVRLLMREPFQAIVTMLRWAVEVPNLLFLLAALDREVSLIQLCMSRLNQTDGNANWSKSRPRRSKCQAYNKLTCYKLQIQLQSDVKLPN